MAATFEIIDQVGKITLNRPSKFNSLTAEMATLVQGYLDTCANDPAIRAVYITGAGRAFCAGQDLNEATDPVNKFDFYVALEERYNPIVRRIRKLQKPVITAINGVAAGAGANLALSGDIVVATASASFMQAFSRLGLVPDSGGTYLLPRLIGFQKALAVSLLADKIGAEEAERMGMIYKMLPDESFEADAWKLATKLAKMPTQGLAYIKEAFNASLTNDFDTQLDLERDLQVKAGETEDYQEGVQAFLEKRKPVFKGK